MMSLYAVFGWLVGGRDWQSRHWGLESFERKALMGMKGGPWEQRNVVIAERGVDIGENRNCPGAGGRGEVVCC